MKDTATTDAKAGPEAKGGSEIKAGSGEKRKAKPAPPLPVTMENIEQAARDLAGQVVATPTIRSGPLSALTGSEVYLKLETLQHTGSFKDRGAYIKMLSLSDAQKENGVIAMSAGNHAQGVAWHAKRLGIPATIVMPEGTPFTKVARTQAHGARVILHGDNINAAEPFAVALAEEEGLTFVHPYADPHIIAGQGTVALEMLAAVPDLDVLVVPIGGGGIISGMTIAAKALRPSIRVVGVEAALYPSMYQLVHGLPPQMGGDTIAEGIAVKTPGAINVEIVKALVDDILLVDEPALENAVQVMLETGKTLAEGAGAAPLAALLSHPGRFSGKKVGLAVCGSNIDSRILAATLMRGMVRAHRLARIRVKIKDTPGVLACVADHIGQTGGNIVEVMHQRMFYDVPVKNAELDIMVETRDQAHVQDILTRLGAAGFPSRLLLDTADDNRRY